jgi:glucose-1-phosphate adenylyltransferase
MEQALAIILAGGRGKRMDLLCYIRPKPALPFAGNCRVIDFTLSNCVHSDLKNITVLVDYQRILMADYLMRWYATNDSICKLSILQPKSGAYLGTADAVYQNLDYLNKQPSDTVLILAGDHIYKMDYRKMLDFHRHMGSDLTVGVIRVPIEQAHRFGTLNVDAENRITGFVEKSPFPQSNLASMGIYAFKKETLIKYLFEDAQEYLSPHDFGYSIMPRIIKKQRVAAFEFKDYWQDIGTVEAYYESNLELLARRPEYSLDSVWPILNSTKTLSVFVGNMFQNVINSLVSPGCTIKGHVENSVLSPGVEVEEGAVVVNSIIMGNTHIGYQSVIDRCILDEDVNIGEFCRIGSGAGLLPGNWDITVLGKGVNIPDQTLIERKCKILPGVGPDVLHSHLIPSGTVVSSPVGNWK